MIIRDGTMVNKKNKNIIKTLYEKNTCNDDGRPDGWIDDAGKL